VFSLGATLYTALEGTPPFGLNNNPIALLHQVASGEIAPPRQSGPLTPVLLRLLQPDPDQRPTMDQAHEALATLVTSPAGPAAGPSAPAPSPPRHDRPFEPVPTTQQTLLQVAPLEETISLGTSTGLYTAAGRAPEEGNHNGWPGRRTLLASVLTVVLLAAGVLVTVLISHGNVTGNSAATNTSGGPAQSVPALPAQPEPASTTQKAPTSTSGGPAQSVPAQPGPSSTTEVTPGVSGGSQATPEQLQGAITDYYALVPGNLPAAWNRLTANYQQNHAGGFTGYQNFWSPVQRVTVVDVSARQGDAVDATIDYFFNDGKVIEEQTSYGLVTEDGLWKIDSSTVHSSQTK
jgi:serine/threonine protein kinase